MEKPKPTQNHEQKQETPEDYVVATFPVDIDPDNARRPLTVIRSGQDGESVKYDRGWNPIGISVVCDTDSEKGIGPIKLLMEAYQLVGTDIKTEFVLLEDIQDLNEDYIKYLCGKTTKEMIEEGKRAAEQIWRQKHSDSMRIESLAPGVGSDSGAETSLGVETPSNGLVEDNTSDHEKPLADEVSPAMGGVAVEATGIKKPADLVATEPVKKPVEADKASAAPTGLPAVESAKKPVETGRVSISPSTLVMSKKVLESIGAVKVDDSVGSPAIKSAAVKELAKNLAVASAKELVVDSIKNPAVKLAKKPAKIDKVDANPADSVATEPVKKPVEADKASADLVDLLAAKSVENPVAEKSMETNETNAGILPEDFKAAINEFKRLTKDNNNQFAGVARSLTGSLSEFRESITRTPTAIKDPRITEFTLRISELEASRVEILNSFIDEGFSEEMFVDSKKDPAKATGILVRKLEGLGEILRGVYAGYSGRDSLVQAIDEVIVDLSTVSRDRWGILDAVNKIKSVWGDDKS